MTSSSEVDLHHPSFSGGGEASWLLTWCSLSVRCLSEEEEEEEEAVCPPGDTAAPGDEPSDWCAAPGCAREGDRGAGTWSPPVSSLTVGWTESACWTSGGGVNVNTSANQSQMSEIRLANSKATFYFCYQPTNRPQLQLSVIAVSGSSRKEMRFLSTTPW